MTSEQRKYFILSINCLPNSHNLKKREQRKGQRLKHYISQRIRRFKDIEKKKTGKRPSGHPEDTYDNTFSLSYYNHNITSISFKVITV